MQKFTINLWFDSQAEEAVQFYTSIFPDSKVGRTVYFSQEGFEYHGKPEGSICTIEFELNGSSFLALNGGPDFRFNEAISIIVHCDTQEDVDYYWDKLSQGGDPAAQQCGWLKDKYGVSWQIVPTTFTENLSSQDKNTVEKTWKAIFNMKKLEISELKKYL